MPKGVFVHDIPQVLALERESYHGGRTEVFYQGKRMGEPFYYLDVNNMYGFVMRNNLYPVSLVGYQEKSNIHFLLRRLEKYDCVARVRVRVDANPFPIKVDGFTAYPLGEFITTLTTPELLLAIRSGWLRHVYSLAWYYRDRIFSSYVDELYGLRQEYDRQGNTGYKEIAKLLINSLYGKFGQTGLEIKAIGERPANEVWDMSVIDAKTGERYRHISIGGTVFEMRQAGESYHSMPVIAAHVTAYARLLLFDMLQMAEILYEESEKFIKCDIPTLGAVTYFPKANKLQIDKVNKWEENGFEFVKNLLSNTNENNPYVKVREVKSDEELRDEFAGLAMNGIMSGDNMVSDYPEMVADLAYSIADAMMKKRKL